MKLFKYLCLLSLFVFASCAEDELSPDSVIDAQAGQTARTDLDEWIEDQLTEPYGIAVEYRWNKYTAPIQGFTTPPDTSRIREMLLTVKDLWIDLYNSSNTGGPDFLKDKKPLKIYLFGGPNLDGNGVELLHTPKSTHVEMYLFNVKTFSADNYLCVYKLMRSEHHQFAKRLMEVFPYDRNAYSRISKPLYTAGSTEFIAKRLKYMNDEMDLFGIVNYGLINGMFTYYSFLSAEDDLAEMISIHLLHTPKEISRLMEDARKPKVGPDDILYEQEKAALEARHQELVQKRDMMLEYFKKEVGIPLNVLQKLSLKKIKRYQ